MREGADHMLARDTYLPTMGGLAVADGRGNLLMNGELTREESDFLDRHGYVLRHEGDNGLGVSEGRGGLGQ
jgi:hypothetical protein